MTPVKQISVSPTLDTNMLVVFYVAVTFLIK